MQRFCLQKCTEVSSCWACQLLSACSDKDRRTTDLLPRFFEFPFPTGFSKPRPDIIGTRHLWAATTVAEPQGSCQAG